MLIVTTIEGLKREREKIPKTATVGFVPTMGALHLGHVSLIQRALAETDFVVVSIFVNPLQFGPNEDLARYPRQLDKDCEICEKLGVHLLFAPSVEEMNAVGDDLTLVVPPKSMTSVLCGKYRPGHFEGVATIVTKLFHLVQPHVAYFGQKDAQQVAIIKRLVRDLNFPVQIKTCPTVREASGLALSSRNQYLTATEKEKATLIYRSLSRVQEAFHRGERKCQPLLDIIHSSFAPPDCGLTLQYAEIVHPDTLQPLSHITDSALVAVAAFCGTTRLIDNVILTVTKPIIALDGPAGAGKSTVSRRLAHQLGYLYLDTGAMYRAVTWLVMENNISPEDEKAIADMVKNVKIELIPSDDLNSPVTVRVNQQDVTKAIRSPEVTRLVSKIAAQKAVREKMVQLQQEYGKKGGIVAEGRDIGTHVFPQAQLKIFLTASPQARAKRRLLELHNQGETDINLEQLITEIQQRDYLDSTREIAPLQKAADAIEINTDNLTVEEVVEKIKSLLNHIPH